MIAVIAGALGLYFWVTPLRTFRPATQEEPRPPLELRLPARLWQDPIQQARESVAQTKTASEIAQGQTQQLPALAPEDLVLAVTVYGGYGQLDHETRLRSRYAVELALDAEGYIPDGEDTEFLRFLALDVTENGGRFSRKVLPFECWMKYPGDPAAGPRKVLVLWIDDTVLGDKPLTNLWSRILSKAHMPETIGRKLHLIGPTTSSGLKDLIQDLKQEKRLKPENIHSPWATADEVFLFPDDAKLEDMNLPAGIDRTIATDRHACARLVEELGRRDFRLRKTPPVSRRQERLGPDTIAVLSEWDTVYGRALPATFASCVLMAAEGRNCGDDTPDALAEFRRNVRSLIKHASPQWPPEVLRVVYLRGLDGIGPRSAERTPGKDKEEKPSMADMERPDGTSQLDYARRLADWLRVRYPSLRAVGVLGGDIYDKLVMLQAMRDRVPGAIFFTTDLDAGYLHPSQNEWSRNLLVASSFGLSERVMARDGKISPPFRDTYGVAIHRSVRHALSGTRKESPLTASIFEIGRTAAFRLVPDDAGAGESPMRAALAGGKEATDALWLLLLLFFSAAMLMMHAGSRALPWWLAAVVFLAVLEWMLLTGARQEPLTWLEGVSIWPTEIIRLIVAAAAVLLLGRADGALRKNLEDLRTGFHFTSPGEQRPFRWPRAWRRLLVKPPAAGPGGRVEAQSLWDCYAGAEQRSGRWWRAGSLTCVILLVVAVSLTLERPMRPCRGDFSCRVDLAAAVLSMAALFLTTCYVADATATCTRWIRCMVSGRTLWPGAGNDSAAGVRGPWNEVEIAARRTQAVGHLILYPFALMLLLILSRSQVFDRWPWPASLVFMFSLPLGLALISALLLRSGAEQLRHQAYAEVRALWVEAVRGGDGTTAQLADTAMKSIEAESRGAFSPITQNPALAAILLPLGGAGTGLALEKLLQSL
jgi:hypothetical protein